MTSILLVFPPPSEEQVGAVPPPLSILYIGAHLENAGIDVSYIDLRVQPLQKLYDELGRGPSLVGVSSMTGFQLVGAMEVLQAVKEHQPDIPTVLGGVHASLLPEECLSDQCVDFVVVGEGEITMLELVGLIDRGERDYRDIMGLGWKTRDGQRIINENRPFMNLADALPPITQTSRDLYRYYQIGKVQVARGCPFRCAFCYNTVFNRRRYRAKPLETIEDEIKTITRLAPHVSHISMLADEIGFDHDRIVDMARLIAKYGYSFHTAIRAENVDDKLMKSIGDICEEIFIGVEHVSPRIRKMIQKDNDLHHIRRAADVLAASKIRTVWSFMTAFPEETLEETLSNMMFADELQALDDKAVISPFFLVTPYPGTELFKLAQGYGYKPPSDLRGWRHFGLGKVTMPWVNEATQIFTDLYGISFVRFLNSKNYQRNPFESQWIAYLKDRADNCWRERNLNFKKEWELFLTYNRHQASQVQ